MFLNNNSTYPVGLDISDLSLKLVQLNKIKNKITIQAIGKVNLPKGLIKNGEIQDKNKVIDAMKKLINNPKFGRVTSEEIIACLPETKTFIKLIEVAKTPNPISEIIEHKIEKHIPMPINEIFYDWQIIEEHADKQLILIGVAPRNIVNQYTSLINEMKLSIVALEIEPTSICHSLLNEEKLKFKTQNQQNYGIIDIGAKRTSMIFYSKNTILFTVSMPVSGEEITNKIAQTLDIHTSQAEKAKIICGLDEDKAQGIIKNILTEIIGDLIQKIESSIKFYNNHFPGRGPIHKILLCGGGANINNLTKIISQAISIKTEIGNPLINLADQQEKFSKILTEKHSLKINFLKKQKQSKNNSKTLTITQNASLTFATAIGMALRGLYIYEE